MIIPRARRGASVCISILAATLTLAVSGCSRGGTATVGSGASAPAPAQQTHAATPIDPAIYRGAGLVHLGCPECHNVGIPGVGPGAKAVAPDFAAVANRQGMNADQIEHWLRYSHPTMPNYFMTDPANHDLAAYIMSLKQAS